MKRLEHAGITCDHTHGFRVAWIRADSSVIVVFVVDRYRNLPIVNRALVSTLGTMLHNLLAVHKLWEIHISWEIDISQGDFCAVQQVLQKMHFSELQFGEIIFVYEGFANKVS